MRTAIATAFLCAALAGPAALAAGVPSVGYLDQAAIAALPAYAAANAKLQSEKTEMDAEFAREMKSASGAVDQARIAQTFQQRFEDRRRALLAPLLARAQNAIAAVAVRRKLGVVLEKQIVIVGGENLTKDVIAALAGTAPIAPPTATPPPSEVGFVDQTVLDQTPSLKKANDDFAKFQAAQEADARKRLQKVTTEAERAVVMRDYEAALLAERKRSIEPVVDRTRGVIGTAAKAKNLVLVLDRASLVYGGTDLTSDVAAALK